MRRVSAVVIATLGLLAAELNADNWPHWRGPSASGVSSEAKLPVRWNDSENVAWKTPVNGLGISSPIVWGNLVVVTSQEAAALFGPGRDWCRAVTRWRRGGVWGRAAVAMRRVRFCDGAGEDHREASGSSSFLRRGRCSVHEKDNLASRSPVTDGERVRLVATAKSPRSIFRKARWKKHLGAEYGLFEMIGATAFTGRLQGSSDPCVLSRVGVVLVFAGLVEGPVRWKVDARRRHVGQHAPGRRVAEDGDRRGLQRRRERRRRRHRRALWHFEEADRYPAPSQPSMDSDLHERRLSQQPFHGVVGGKGDVVASHVRGGFRPALVHSSLVDSTG